MKKILFLLFATLCGSGAALAETELLHPMEYRYGSKTSSPDYLSLSDLSTGNSSNTSFDSSYDSSYNRYYYNITHNFPAGQYGYGYELFRYSHEVPSYARAKVTIYTGIYMYNYAYTANKETVPCTTALYIYDTESEARSASLPCKAKAQTNYSSCDAVKNHLIKYVYNQGDKESSSYQMSFYSRIQLDNSTNSSAATHNRYLVQTCCSNPSSSGSQKGVLIIYSSSGKFESVSYDYYKTVSFNANGGTGSMSSQSVVNSATLTTCAFSKAGKDFLGWNTKADGTGTSYADGATITATESSKGPVTLYAMWGDHVFDDDDLLRSVCTRCGNHFLRYTSNSGALSLSTSATFNDKDGNKLNVIDNRQDADGSFYLAFDKEVAQIGTYAFYRCTSLVNITIPNSVTSIGNDAFNGCSSLADITIPNSVTSIGNDAFNGCTSLADITIPNSVTSIGNNAFSGCKGLASVTIPSSVSSIGSNAFYGCVSLADITIPNSVTSIKEYTFHSCTGLANITISNSVTSIGSYAFYGCTSLADITIPNSVTSIEGYAFTGCTSLTDITIPNSVTSIEEYTFHGCTSLADITIPNSVTSIGNKAFAKCSSLTNFYVDWMTPLALSSDKYIFENCNLSNATLHVPSGSKANYQSAAVWKSFGKFSEGLDIIYYTSQDNKVIDFVNDDSFGPTIQTNTYQNGIGKIVFNGDVTRIGSDAFLNSSLSSITIPSSVTSIGVSSFQNCPSLSSITIPSSVTSIGKRAFSGCSGLTDVYVEWNTPLVIDTESFDATILSHVTLHVPYGTQELYQAAEGWKDFNEIKEYKAFIYYTSSDNQIVVPYKADAFGLKIQSNTYCNGQGKIVFDGEVTSIGDFAFNKCVGLSSITIPSGVTSIGYSAFSSCTSLANITIPNSVTSIGQYAFFYCSSLTSITIPSSVISIGENAFFGCPGLASITVASGNTKYDSHNNCNAIIETQSHTLIRGCQNTVIPDNVTSIGNGAFSDCDSLTSITLPSSVTSIGDRAFAYCESLSDFYVEWDEPLVISASYVFLNSNRSNATLHVPSGTKSKYAAADVWKSFGEIVEYGIIYYTACLDDPFVLSNPAAFDANILTPTCQGRQGSIVFDRSVTSIGDNAFSFWIILTGITIPSSVTSIGKEVFHGCVRLEDLVVESGNQVYDSRNDCNAIIETATNTLIAGCMATVIPYTVTSIGQSAFIGCSGLTSITIPSSVTSIGQSAFGDCTNLKDYYVDWNTPLAIAADVFSGCNLSQATLYVPAGTKSLYEAAEVWQDFGTIVEITIPDNEIWYTSSDGKVVTPYKADVFGATIQTNTYQNGKGKIVFSGDVTSIGNNAFSGCTGLANITIPSSVTSIGDYAFNNCSGLANITIPSSVTSIGNNAFNGCSSLTDCYVGMRVPIVYDIKYSDTDPFRNSNRSKATLHVPYGTKARYEAADIWYKFGTIVETPPIKSVICYTSSDGKVVTPDTSAFEAVIESNTYADGQGKIVFATDLEAIGADAFKCCTGLTGITIPSSVTSIGGGAFTSCNSLVSITIPSSVTSIDGSAFNGCSGLTSIIVNDGNRTYDSRNGCNAIIETATNTLIAGCQNTVIPNTVTSIGGHAFDTRTGLTSITIPSSVTSIGQFAFGDCSGLKDCYVDWNSPLAIVDDAFSDCNLSQATLHVPAGTKALYEAAEVWQDFGTIVEITIPDNEIWYTSSDGKVVTPYKADVFGATIQTNTYQDGKGKIVFSGDVTSIGNYAFSGCTGLANITIPSSVTSIGDYAFYECSSLTNITIPISVTSIGNNAFSGCSGLANITIPSSVTSIGGFAFYDCSSLTGITIPSSVTSIGGGAFSDCSSLTDCYVGMRVPIDCDEDPFSNSNRSKATLHVPYGTKARYEAADTWKKFGTIVENAPIKSVICYTSSDGKVVTPDTYAFDAVIESNTYADGQGKIVFATDLEAIGDNAFFGCTGLTGITIPSSVTSIGCDAFTCCTGLASITIPSSVTSIRVSAFNGCSGLANITISSSVTSIDGSAFNGCSGLTSIIVNDGNRTYDSRNGCNAIIETSTNKLIAGCQNTVIPNTVTSIGVYAFDTRTGLTSITIPSSVTSIEQRAFQGCSGLTSITIPSGVTSIRESAFNGCSGLTSIDIPSSLTSISIDAFSACSRLATITVEADNDTYDSRNGCNAIIETKTNTLIAGCKATVIPNTVTGIGDYAFGNCSNMTSITIPSSVTSIGYCAFSCCSGLTNITIPSSVTSIANYAFYSCDKLNSVEFQSVPWVDDAAFVDVASACQYTLALTDDSYVYTGSNDSIPTLTAEPTYSRTLGNPWGTIVLPFAVKNSDKYCFYTLTDVSGSELTITKVANESVLPAGTPALVYMTDKAQNAETGKYDLKLTAANTDINTAISTPAAISGLALTGTYSAQNIAGENGYFISGGKFYSIAAQKAQNSSIKINLGAFRAYLAGTLVNGASQLRLNISDEEIETALEVLDSLSAGEGRGEAIYDLDGRRLDALQQGVNIIKKGNKSIKVIVK